MVALDTASITRTREFHDLIERFIETRRRSFYPRAQRLAAEAGISDRALLFLGYVRQVLNADGIATKAALRRRVVYSAKEGWAQRFEELSGQGLAEPVADGWRLTTAGRGLMERFWAENRDHQASLPLPATAVRRVVEAVEAVVRRIETRPTDRVGMLRRLAPDDRMRQPDAVRLEFAIFELAVSLDDGHIAAWERAGYTGPVLDVLTRVWRGKDTHVELVKDLAFSQEPEQVDRHLEELVRRGDLRREGDRIVLTDQGRAAREGIERETDRLGLSHWPSGTQLESLTKDLTEIVEAIPLDEALAKAPTH